MPIGKNSIKRVANNGYSNLKTQAPDMENSTIVDKEREKASVTVAPTEKKTAPSRKKPCAKKTEPKPSEVKTVEKASAQAQSDAEYVNLGDELPVYLL